MRNDTQQPLRLPWLTAAVDEIERKFGLTVRKTCRVCGGQMIREMSDELADAFSRCARCFATEVEA